MSGISDKVMPLFQRVGCANYGWGRRFQLALGAGPLKLNWNLTVVEHEPMTRFVDLQTSGPFASWQHVHEFASEDDHSRVSDTITFTLPGGIIGRVVAWLVVRRVIQLSFGPRARATRKLLEG